MKSIEAGAVAQKQVEQAEAEARKARFDLFNAQQMLINLGLPLDAERLATDSDDELLRYVKLLGLPESLTEKLDAKTATANLLPLLASFDGVVIGQDIVNGEVVSPERMAVEIADMRRMLIKMNVRVESADELKTRPARGVQRQRRGSFWRYLLDQHRALTKRLAPSRFARWSITPPFTTPRVAREPIACCGPICSARPKYRLEEKPGAMVVPTKAVQWDGAAHVVFVRTGEAVFDMRARRHRHRDRGIHGIARWREDRRKRSGRGQSHLEIGVAAHGRRMTSGSELP